jgi:hypothetical protein
LKPAKVLIGAAVKASWLGEDEPEVTVNVVLALALA